MRSTTVSFTVSSSASSPQIDSLITAASVVRPLIAAGSAAIISPVISKALHSALPMISHILIIILKMIIAIISIIIAFASLHN